jgi:multiple sugar transport system ATP-binding protein
MNFYDISLSGNVATFSDGNKITLPDTIIKNLGGRQGEMVLGIRGEDIKLDAQNIDLFRENKQIATIENAEVMGNENNLYFTFGGSQTIARVSKYEISRAGDEIEFVFIPSRMHFFDKETEVCYV